MKALKTALFSFGMTALVFTGAQAQESDDIRTRMKRILFKQGTTHFLTQEDSLYTLEIGAALAANPRWDVTVIGYTEDRGGKAANDELAELRAEKVAMMIEKCGVNSRNISQITVGSAEFYGQKTEDNRQFHRAVGLAIGSSSSPY